MSLGLLLAGFLGAVNPCRIRLALPRGPGVTALGAAVALAVGAVLAAVGASLLDAIDVSPESFRLAAGIVLAVEGARTLVAPRPAAEPELPGLRAALVPVAFPLLLQPGVVVLALAAGGDGVAWSGVAALAVALALAVAVSWAPPSPLFLAGARVLGAVELAAGVALAIAGIDDV